MRWKYKHSSSTAVDSQLTPQCIYFICIFLQSLLQNNVWFVFLYRWSIEQSSQLLFFLFSIVSAALFPGVPVAGRFCSLRDGCLPVHWGLLQCCRCKKRGQHWSPLVCPDCSLQPVSFNSKVTEQISQSYWLILDSLNVWFCTCRLNIFVKIK